MKLFKNLNTPIKLAISLSILVALVIRVQQKDHDIVSDIATNIHASAWAYSTIFMLAQFVLLSLRWEFLLNIGKRHLNFTEALRINLTSQLANLVFITSVGGIVARIALSAQQGATIFKTLIATAFDRVLTLSALVLMSALFVPNLSHYVDSKTFSALVGYLGIIIFVLFLFAPLFINRVVMRMPQVTRLKGRLRYGLRYLRILLNKPLLLGKIILISLAAQMAFFLAVYSLVYASGADINFWQMMIVLPVVSLIAALPISIGGWGVREGAYVYGFGLLGVPMEVAFLISVQVGLISMLATVAAGIPSLMASNIELSKMTSVKEALGRVRF